MNKFIESGNTPKIGPNSSFNVSPLFQVGRVKLSDFSIYVTAFAQNKLACLQANCTLGLIEPVKGRALEETIKQFIEEKGRPLHGINVFLGLGKVLNAEFDDYILEKSNLLLSQQGHKERADKKDLSVNQSLEALIPTTENLVVELLINDFIEKAQHFSSALETKSNEFQDILKYGRISLRETLPISLGNELESYNGVINRLMKRLEGEKKNWRYSCLGFTPVGTGLGISPGFQEKANEALSKITGREFDPALNPLVTLQASDNILILHSVIEAFSMVVWKLARDLRILCSGPRCGIAELVVPPVAPGSSIMPGKVNPVIAEMVMSTTDQIDANHLGVIMGAKSGWLESGSTSSVPFRSLMSSCDLLGRSMKVFADKCISGLKLLNITMADKNLQDAHVLLLRQLLKDQLVDRVIEFSDKNGCTLKEAAVTLGFLKPSEADDIFKNSSLFDPWKNQEVVKGFAADC